MRLQVRSKGGKLINLSLRPIHKNTIVLRVATTFGKRTGYVAEEIFSVSFQHLELDLTNVVKSGFQWRSYVGWGGDLPLASYL